jgi:hypothetical protein
MTEPKKPMTDAERLLHQAFRGLLLPVDGYKMRHWRKYTPAELAEAQATYERDCAAAEGPEDIEDPVDREREEE